MSLAGASAGGGQPEDVRAASGGGFARRSSGLVKGFSQLDAWVYNVLAMNIVIFGSLNFGTIAATYPHSSLWLPFLIAGVFCCCEAVAYALLCAAMPRSGGDYVFGTRILGGAIGTIGAFTNAGLSQLVSIGIGGFTLSALILSPFFALLGGEYGSHTLASLSTWFGGKDGAFVCAIAIALWGAFLNIRGLRVYATVQRYLFFVGAICLLVFIVVMLFTSHSTFVGNFNVFMEHSFHVKGAYAKTIAAAGHQSHAFKWGQTIAAGVIAGFALNTPAWGAMQAGEIRRASSVRNNLKSILGAEVFTMIGLALIGALVAARVGHSFLWSAQTLFNTGSPHNPIPVPPFLGLLFAVAGGSAFFVWLSFIMFICWIAVFFTNATLGSSRCMMAMAFDRILPERLGQVSKKWHTPVVAITIFTTVSIPIAALYCFSPGFVTFTNSYFIILATSVGITMLAAALFPFSRPELYRSSPIAKYQLGKVPVITVMGGMFVFWALFSIVQALRDSALGINATKGLVMVFGMYILSGIIYFVAKVYRKNKEGLDISAFYTELPVE